MLSDYAIQCKFDLCGKMFKRCCSIVKLVGVVGAGKGHKVAAKTTHDDCSGPG